MAELKSVEPDYDGQRVGLRAYYKDTLTGGGKFIGYTNDTTSSDDGGFFCVRVSDTKVWKRVQDKPLTFYDGGARHEDTFDNSWVLQNAVNIPKAHVGIPNKYFHIRYGITVPANAGVRLYGLGAPNYGSVFRYAPANDDPAESFIKVGEAGGQITYSGFEMTGITVDGGGAIKHGLELHYVHHPKIDCKIINFKGSGILIDKIQDGDINFSGVQKCGRTKGDYNNLDDITNIELTEYAPIHIISTMSGDSPNMLRLNDLQIENNNCCPYIYIENCMGIWLNRIHSEHRQGPMAGAKNGTWLVLGKDKTSDTEVYIKDCQISEFKTLIHARGYGRLTISNNGRSGGFKHTTPNLRFYLDANNQHFDSIEFNSSIIANMDTVTTNSLSWRYAARENNISNSTIGALTITENGSSPSLYFTNCSYESVIANTSNIEFKSGKCTGDFTYRSLGGNGAVCEVDIKGDANISTEYGTAYIPYIKKAFHQGDISKIKNNNNYPNGSEWYNLDAASAGDIYMWKKINDVWVAMIKLQ